MLKTLPPIPKNERLFVYRSTIPKKVIRQTAFVLFFFLTLGISSGFIFAYKDLGSINLAFQELALPLTLLPVFFISLFLLLVFIDDLVELYEKKRINSAYDNPLWTLPIPKSKKKVIVSPRDIYHEEAGIHSFKRLQSFHTHQQKSNVFQKITLVFYRRSGFVNIVHFFVPSSNLKTTQELVDFLNHKKNPFQTNHGYLVGFLILLLAILLRILLF